MDSYLETFAQRDYFRDQRHDASKDLTAIRKGSGARRKCSSIFI